MFDDIKRLGDQAQKYAPPQNSAPSPTSDSYPPEPENKRRFKIKARWLVTLIAIFVLLGVALLFISMYNRPPQQTNLNPFAPGAGDEVSFSLYYPGKLPKGFSLNSQSLQIQKGVVSFNYQYTDGNRLIITEEAVPSVIEQVTKTKQFNTSVGQAYIADLNGHATGFVETARTLIILSSAQNFSSDQLQEIMTSFQQAK